MDAPKYLKPRIPYKQIMRWTGDNVEAFRAWAGTTESGMSRLALEHPDPDYPFPFMRPRFYFTDDEHTDLYGGELFVIDDIEHNDISNVRIISGGNQELEEEELFFNHVEQNWEPPTNA